MNVGFEDYNTADTATMLGVQKCTISYWCRKGYIKYQDVSSAGSSKPRYMFTIDEINRVSKLIQKYGKNAWCNHADEGLTKVTEVIKEAVNEADEITNTIQKILSLKKQREKILDELDSVENAIKAMKEKVIKEIDI